MVRLLDCCRVKVAGCQLQVAGGGVRCKQHGLTFKGQVAGSMKVSNYNP